jgi:hypothetical protein
MNFLRRVGLSVPVTACAASLPVQALHRFLPSNSTRRFLAERRVDGYDN